ncbi:MULTISPECIES: SgrR family transcriptional regulator [Tatumella]|uniref:SgrR family transcriptional regulator n=1 Tax=Tatumella punctata TaxID=399969 RepID=A0ABW1VS55_9GAMM|nr:MULTISPECIES: SgrR family transcriptional regulator [unclassified Tatumella]MBS0878080.1 SgrR family transcriptional regulator [Tatumella sp. JGM82]MBS0890439.1 SgrR family transcriptional regulator [Tatumella sp. JGM94]MBS0900895.1 SgrR family transcriptional regulator [Tatumella sp. JGM100]
MPVTRLEQHYLRLLNYFPSRDITTTLGALADQLCCTKRHMRSLLLRMQDAGWLEWQANAGRGHQSRLILRCSEQQLLLAKAEHLLDDGDIGSAVRLLDNQQPLVSALLRKKLGYSVRQDRQSLRIPYYRTMPHLYPGTPLRRSEAHLVKQIFSGLTRINPQSGRPEADLAHFWSQSSELKWSFHLRPAVRFHDGKELTSKDVVASLIRSAELPLFSHLRQVTAQGSLTVVIELSQPDPQLPLLLTDTAALILPADHASRKDFAVRPIGSGPYFVAENDQWHLRMQAFDDYFGFRGLLDDIEVIVWPLSEQGEAAPPAEATARLHPVAPAAWLSSSLSDIEYTSGMAAGLSGPPDDVSGEMFPEKGGYFLLCDSRSAYWKKPEHRRWIREVLNPYALIQRFIAPIRPFWIPAGSLLPDWLHYMDDGPVTIPPFTRQSEGCGQLTLAYHLQHPEFAMLACEMQHLLQQHNITLTLLGLEYQQWARGDAEADLWLGTVNFAVPESWHVGSWLLGMPLLKHSVSGGDRQRFAGWQQQWREQTLGAKQLTREVIRDGWLQPLFHHWMRLKGPGQAQGIHLNNLGWFDFTRAWMVPPAADN